MSHLRPVKFLELEAFHDRVAVEYPQRRKQLRYSSELKRSRQVPRNGQSVSLLRQRAVRTRALSFAKQSSMGLRSGLAARGESPYS